MGLSVNPTYFDELHRAHWWPSGSVRSEGSTGLGAQLTGS